MILNVLKFSRLPAGLQQKFRLYISVFWGGLAIHCQAQPAPLMEEGFDYPAGTSLAANPPWAGSSGASVEVVSGNLAQSNLRNIVPAGNMLQITGGAGLNVYRNFSSSPVTGGSVYVSALVQCKQLPTGTQFIASLMDAGNTSPSQSDDALDLYVTPATNGYYFRIRRAGSDSATARVSLAANTTHFIVVKYSFGLGGQASIYVDPTPGVAEPSFPDARTESDDDGGGSAGPSNLQIILLGSSSSSAQGVFDFDTLRVGTAWTDVASATQSLSLNGPADQSACYGGGAMFTVQPLGTPPFTYQWRTNATPMADATNSTLILWSSPGVDLSQLDYDVVVQDAFGAVTSRLAILSFTTNSPGIATPPASQLMLPWVSNAIFSVAASGDAPFSYQWRSNGVALSGATNASYALSNVGPADAIGAYDVVVANPCGSITSSPPVSVQFPNQFHEAFDSGPGFFGGENLIFTNTSGLSFFVWSSSTLSAPVTAWTLEGPMSETLLGTTGESRYGFNVNPATSPAYYIFARKNTGPYLDAEPLIWLTTPDFASFTVISSNVPINSAGLFNPNSFNTAYDAGPGFFGGENLIFTNASGQSFGVWSSPDPSVSVTNWVYEGPMNETLLGATGMSRYGLNVNPTTSPEYYILAHANTGNFTPTEPLVWLTTPDFASFTLAAAEYAITSGGVFQILVPPSIVQPPQNQVVLSGQSPTFQVTASGSQLSYQWVKSNSGPVAVSAPVLTLSNVSAAAAGDYYVIVSNSAASVTSSAATLTVVSPPQLSSAPPTSSAPGQLQLNANSLAGLTYVVEMATNLVNPVWQPVLTNNTGTTGNINFQTNTTGGSSVFYRLAFP